MAEQSETVASFRACFMTDPGKRVLGQILMDGGYFDTDLETEGELAVQNFVKKIVRNLGICQDPRGVGSYVQALMNLPSK